MTTLNWNIFKAKFHQRENKVFESLAYCLFCYELGIRIGVFRFKNQTGIETEPIEMEGKKVGFPENKFLHHYFQSPLSLSELLH